MILDSNGEHAQAALLFEQLAEKSRPPKQLQWLLYAAENHLLAHDPNAANRLLTSTNTHQWPGLDFWRYLLLSELALQQNHPYQALALLKQPPGKEIIAEHRYRYHLNRAKSFRLAGNLLESARALGELDLILLDKQERMENQQALLQTLTTLTDTALELLQPDPPGILGGWMELARILKIYAGDPNQRQPQLKRWREQHPNHPALPGDYFQQIKAQYRRLSHIGILLPMNGPYAKEANALRNGLMAAYYNQPKEKRPELRFYDSSNQAAIWPLYRQAVDAGADMIIGPLGKSAVAQLARAGELEAPVLALNQVVPEVTPPANLYQFSLSPEDEAQQVAERARLDGHTHALVLTPQGAWGERLFSSFLDHWERLGGNLAEHQTYDVRKHDFSEPIRALLNIDESDERRRSLQRTLGTKIQFEPRRRQDSDFIFLAAKEQQGREIRPQLQFHHASKLAIYATSHIYSGRPDPKQDRDLEGIRFLDIPWLLADAGNEPLSRIQLAETLPESRTAYRRLYAMGTDSYHLLPHLARLQSNPWETLNGATGILSLDKLNHFHRQLVWAQMRGGTAQVLDYAQQLETPGNKGFEELKLKTSFKTDRPVNTRNDDQDRTVPLRP